VSTAVFSVVAQVAQERRRTVILFYWEGLCTSIATLTFLNNYKNCDFYSVWSVPAHVDHTGTAKYLFFPVFVAKKKNSSNHAYQQSTVSKDFPKKKSFSFTVNVT